MIRKTCLFACLLFFTTLFSTRAQDPVWYDYSLTYYKIPTARDGIYRISPEVLKASGLNTETLDPSGKRSGHPRRGRK